MGKLQWYFNRLRAMSLPEVGWRIQQKSLQRKERKAYGQHEVAVIAFLFDKRLEQLKFNPQSLGINFDNHTFGTNTTIHLLGGYSYEECKKRWNAGFQTDKVWGDDFSYSLNYKQRDDIGDARTNWELNRHFQFALLAKAFYVTEDRNYFNELKDLFYDWNEKNPFLHGISWTSVMEVAIRCIQWCLTLAFLSSCKNLTYEKILEDLEVGIKNMASYIAQHYSRFSSANNHLLVEATAIAFAGFVFGNDDWKRLAIRILDEELTKQNYADGVNKEMSLHYQTFGMEAYALVMHLMQVNGMVVPKWFDNFFSNMCKFVVYSMVSETKVCEFGDNDEGKVLDLEGGEISHYRYVLQLCSLVLNKRYETFNHVSETVSWLFAEKEIKNMQHLPYSAKASESITFPSGGYTFIRNNDGKIIIGIDHAPLGFGSIAAHGHADALSFQLFVNGLCIFGDPGTYIYHCWLDKRNEFRRSCNHNTVWIKDGEQSQMLGAFLWGKKAKTSLKSSLLNNEDKDLIVAESRWQNGDVHHRKISFDKEKSIICIDDELKSSFYGYATFILHPESSVSTNGTTLTIEREGIVIKMSSESVPIIEESWYSERYGIEEKTKKIVYKLIDNRLSVKIWIEKY